MGEIHIHVPGFLIRKCEPYGKGQIASLKDIYTTKSQQRHIVSVIKYCIYTAVFKRKQVTQF